MRRPTRRQLLAIALAPALALASGDASARPKPPACEPGTFVLREPDGLVPGSAVNPDSIVVAADGSVATASGCPQVAGKLAAGRRGSKLSARWTKKLGLCDGITKKATLKASFDDACDVLSGTFKTKGTKRRFSARRAGGALGGGNVEAFAAEFRGAIAQVVAEVVASLPPPSGEPLETLGPIEVQGALGSVAVTGVRHPRPAPARYELTLDFAGYQPTPGGVVLGGTTQLNVVVVEGGGGGAPEAYGLARGRLVLAGTLGGDVEIQASLLTDGPGGTRATTPQGTFLAGPEPPPYLTWVSTVAGGHGAGSADGGPAEAQFDEPSGIAVDANLRAYVADSGNGTVREIAPDGDVSTLAQGFRTPYDLGLDDDGDLVVSDRLSGPHAGDAPLARVHLGAPLRGAVEPIVGGDDKPCESNAIFGTCDGRSPIAGMPYAGGISVGAITYVAQWEFPPALRAVLPDGYLMTVARGAFTVDDGVYQPEDVAAGRSGELYFTADHTVRVRLPDGSYRVLSGAVNDADDTDGPGALARLSSPKGIVYDGLHTLYIAEWTGWIIRAVDAFTGETYTVAGCKGPPVCPGARSGLRDGPGEQALFDSPRNLALDRFGDLWIADEDNNAIRHVRILADPERVPEIVDVSPHGVQQGDAARVVVRGKNLALAEAADLGEDVAVTVESASHYEAVLHVDVAARAEVGTRSLRVTTPYGVAKADPGLGFAILPEARGGATVETLAGIGSLAQAGQDVVPGPLTAFVVPTGLYAESGDRILVADPYLQVVRLVATREGVVAEIIDLITATTLGMDVNALDTVLGGLGSLGTALEGLGIRQAWTDQAADAIRDAAEAAVDAVCAGQDCTWMSMPWAGVPFAPGESGGFRIGARLTFPTDITRAGASTYYIADTGNELLRIVGFDPEKQASAVNQVFSLDKFRNWPFSVASGPAGNLVAYASLPEDTVLGRADVEHDSLLSQWAGDRRDPSCKQQEGSPWPPIGIPIGTAGDDDALWVADPYCKTVWRVEDTNAVAHVRDVRTQNHVEPAPDCADGPVAFATFKAPMDVAVVGDTVWVADAGCHSIRKIEARGADPDAVLSGLKDFLESNAARIGEETAGKIRDALDSVDADFLDQNRYWVTTVAGSTDGVAGFADGPAGESRFRYPTGIAAVEFQGGTRIFVADTGNRRLRMISVP